MKKLELCKFCGKMAHHTTKTCPFKTEDLSKLESFECMCSCHYGNVEEEPKKECHHQFWKDRNPPECMNCGKTEEELFKEEIKKEYQTGYEDGWKAAEKQYRIERDILLKDKYVKD